jgi:hypothetical protein
VEKKLIKSRKLKENNLKNRTVKKIIKLIRSFKKPIARFYKSEIKKKQNRIQIEKNQSKPKKPSQTQKTCFCSKIMELNQNKSV